MKEIRLHGRGGQGIVTAADIIVWAAVQDDMYGTSVPYFGFEKKGGPVSAFVRLDNAPILQKTQVYNPDCVVVVDPTLLNSINVFEGASEGSTLVINAENYSFDNVPDNIEKIAQVNATKIALDVIGKPIPNTATLGAFAAATDWVDIEHLKKRVGEVFGEKNIEACERGYQETKICEVNK